MYKESLGFRELHWHIGTSLVHEPASQISNSRKGTFLNEIKQESCYYFPSVSRIEHSWLKTLATSFVFVRPNLYGEGELSSSTQPCIMSFSLY